MKRHFIAVFVISLLSLTAVFLAVNASPAANAQSETAFWNSSAEPPAETPVTYSAPDSPVLHNGEDDLMNGGGLVSWRITGAALKPRENDVSYTVDSNGSCVFVTTGDASTVWNTPISLPNGSRIDTLRMYYNDTSAFNTTAYFTIYDLYGAIVNEWPVSSNTTFGNSFDDSAQINHVIDYSVYSYMINWRPGTSGSSIQLCGFRVFYERPGYGLGFIPAVLNNP